MAEKNWEELDSKEQAKYNKLNFDESLLTLFTNNFELYGQKHRSTGYFERACYTNDVNLRNVSGAPQLEFIDCYFLGNCTISGTTRPKIRFERCVIHGELTFNCHKDESRKYSVELYDIAVKKQISVQKGSFSVFYLDTEKVPKISIVGGGFNEALIGGWKNKIEIKEVFVAASNVQGSLKLYGARIEKLYVSGNNRDLNLFFENLMINSFTINKGKNESRFRIQNIRPYKTDATNTEFVIYDSNLAGAEFYETDLGAFDDVVFHDSFLAETTFVNVDWPRQITPYGGKFIEDEEKTCNDKITYHKKAKDNYRQIKYALNKQGDVINEHHFHALEMNAYDNTLDYSWKNFGTKLILKLSKNLSDFGQGLWRPFRALVIVDACLYFLMIICFKYKGYYVSFRDANTNSTLNAFAELVRLMNPLHRNEPELQGVPLLLDIVMRVWSSYMIYNLVRASRRFIK